MNKHHGIRRKNMLKEKENEKAGSGTSGLVPLSALLGIILAVVAALSAAAAGFGSSVSWWNYRTGFTILRWSAYLAIVAGLTSAAGGVAALFRGGKTALLLSIAGFLLSLAVIGTVGSWWLTARSVPQIHDISTDTENPPAFVIISSIRQNAQNSLEYGGPGVARQQHTFYPDIKPLLLAIPINKAFEDALAAAQSIGWQIIVADRTQRRSRLWPLPDGFISRMTSWSGYRKPMDKAALISGQYRGLARVMSAPTPGASGHISKSSKK